MVLCTWKMLGVGRERGETRKRLSDSDSDSNNDEGAVKVLPVSKECHTWSCLRARIVRSMRLSSLYCLLTACRTYSWYYPAAKSSEDIPTVPKYKFRSTAWVSRHTVNQKTILLSGPSKFAETYKKYACLSSWVTLFTNNIQARILFASLAFVQNALK